jgi:hypothetical protein
MAGKSDLFQRLSSTTQEHSVWGTRREQGVGRRHYWESDFPFKEKIKRFAV